MPAAMIPTELTTSCRNFRCTRSRRGRSGAWLYIEVADIMPCGSVKPFDSSIMEGARIFEAAVHGAMKRW